MKYLPAFALLSIILIPSTSFASSAPISGSASSQELSAELNALSAELATPTPGTTSFTLSPGQSILQATSSATGGILKVTLPYFEHTNPVPGDQEPITYLARITLQYMPCSATTTSVCVATASTAYPVMSSDLANGADTGYLHYLITLTNLSSTTATFQITDSSFFADVQNQINAIAEQVHAM
jgi:hypothetical protein